MGKRRSINGFRVLGAVGIATLSWLFAGGMQWTEEVEAMPNAYQSLEERTETAIEKSAISTPIADYTSAPEGEHVVNTDYISANSLDTFSLFIPTSIPTMINTPTHSVSPTSRALIGYSLDEFSWLIRDNGYDGLWSEGLFAYISYDTQWGIVPAIPNYVSHANYKNYSAYFIHSRKGGNRLYYVPEGTIVAVINKDSTSWYVIDGVYRYIGTQDDKFCSYTKNGPFYDAEGNRLSPDALLSRHYTKPFVIQTCYCEDSKGGVLILTGSETSAP